MQRNGWTTVVLQYSTAVFSQGNGSVGIRALNQACQPLRFKLAYKHSFIYYLHLSSFCKLFISSISQHIFYDIWGRIGDTSPLLIYNNLKFSSTFVTPTSTLCYITALSISTDKQTIVKKQSVLMYFLNTMLQQIYQFTICSLPDSDTHTHSLRERSITIPQGPGDKQLQHHGKHQTAEALRWVFC